MGKQKRERVGWKGIHSRSTTGAAAGQGRGGGVNISMVQGDPCSAGRHEAVQRGLMS